MDECGHTNCSALQGRQCADHQCKSRCSSPGCPCCTGSGKTLAYLLPMLLGLSGQGPGPGPRAAVMAPTRELAAQIARVLDSLLPGSGLRSSLLSSSTAAGTDFAKVAGNCSSQCSAPPTAGLHLLFHAAAPACS